MSIEFFGEIWFWKGPSPFYFVTVPPKQSNELSELSSRVSYGWGMIPVDATIGSTTWYTALWPKDGQYILPLKSAIRKKEGLDEGDTVTARIHVRQPTSPFGP